MPFGPKQSQPDFLIIHPRRGLLILETKDWRLETIKQASWQAWEIIPDGHWPKHATEPSRCRKTRTMTAFR